jgi:hypothetical protein
VRALAGLFLDRSFGLLPYAPVFVLALAGIRPILGCLAGSGSRAPQADAGRATRKTVLAAHLMLAAALLAPVLAWRMWWGGQCPPARFLVPLAPLFGLCVALRLAAGSERGLARWRFRLVASGYALFAFMAWRPARLLMLNRRNLPTRVWEALAGDVSLERYLPSLVWPDAREERLALVWILGLGALLLWDAVVSKLQARS